MLSNDILRSVRYILKANNNDLVRILALGNVEATAEQIAVWLRKEDEEGSLSGHCFVVIPQWPDL